MSSPQKARRSNDTDRTRGSIQNSVGSHEALSDLYVEQALKEDENKKQGSGREDRSKPPTAIGNHPRLQSFISNAVEATNPSIRHIAQKSSVSSLRRDSFGSRRNSITSRRDSLNLDIRSPSLRRHSSTRNYTGKRASSSGPTSPRSPGFSDSSSRGRIQISTTLDEQRWSGPRNVDINNTTRHWSAIPEVPSRSGSALDSRTLASSHGHRSINYGGAAGSEDDTLVSNRGSTRLDPDTAAKYKERASEFAAVDNEPKTAASVAGSEDDVEYPGAVKLLVLVTGIALSVFLISLDRTIITTAIPFISNEFDSASDVGWYGSAYLLTASAFQPLYGRIFTTFNIKWAYLTSLCLFLVGSLVCGLAPSSFVLIIGRAIAGYGSAGILTGSFVVVAHAVPLGQRPLLTAIVGLMFGVGAVVGPLLGGVFTDLLTWRWCFYFNLPVGGATLIAMIFFFKPPKHHALMGESFLYRLLELDLPGNLILLSASVMLFLALQFTEQSYSWSDPTIIGLLAGSGCGFVLFTAWMWWKNDGALMPPRILGQRTVAASCAAAFFIYSCVLIHTYYLPTWFQAVQGASAVHSGVDMIPYVAANAIFSLLAGIFVSRNGMFMVPAVIGMVIGAIGSGLISTFTPDMPSSRWIGFEILTSAGIGMAIQQGFTAVQIVLPQDEVAIGTAAVVAFQSLGGAVFVSVGNNILQNSLRESSKSGLLPGIDIQAIIDAGASGFRDILAPQQFPMMIDAYNHALQKVFTASIPVAALAVICCCFMERRTVAKSPDKQKEVLELKERQGSMSEAGMNPERGGIEAPSAVHVGYDHNDTSEGESMGRPGGWWRRSSNRSRPQKATRSESFT